MVSDLEKNRYLKKIKKLDVLVQKILQANPRYDYNDIFHICKNLDLSLEDRLAKGLQRYG